MVGRLFLLVALSGCASEGEDAARGDGCTFVVSADYAYQPDGTYSYAGECYFRSDTAGDYDDFDLSACCPPGTVALGFADSSRGTVVCGY